MDKSKTVILLDNGHGINTPGKCSCDKRILEWSYVREIVKGIVKKLDEDGISYYLVHPEDKEFTSQSYDLKLRTDRANKKYAELKKEGKAALFVSVHLNAAGGTGWQKASGFCVYVSNSASANSKKFAKLIYDEAAKNDLKGNRATPKEKYHTADFWVLRKTNMPAVLTENLFMTNKAEVEYLLSEKGKQTIIDIHVNAIKNYINML